MEGDLQDPISLAAACREAWAVISTSDPARTRPAKDGGEETDRQDRVNLVDAARRARAGSFIYVSDPVPGDLPADGWSAIEHRLRESGMTYTILQPSPCMEVWLSPTHGFDYRHARVTICGTGQDRINWISLDDVAQFAVLSLDNPAAGNATFQLDGPGALSLREVVRIFEEVGDRPFEVQYAAEEALGAQEAGAINSPGKLYASLMFSSPPTGGAAMRRTREVFPMKLISIRDYAARVLQVRSSGFMSL